MEDMRLYHRIIEFYLGPLAEIRMDRALIFGRIMLLYYSMDVLEFVP